MAREQVAGTATSAASGAASGAMIGSVVPGIGTAIGAIAGGIIGGVAGFFGSKRKKYKAPNMASSTVYGYDMNGNLVSKGSYSYNSATGQYELKGGELSPSEKALRSNLAQNIGNLINSVGSTPDAFVRYAKELSDTYYKQGEKKLTEAYTKNQQQLDESMARRGLTGSRASADLTAELAEKRLSALEDLYGSAQNYGVNTQSNLMEQNRAALGRLAGYQQQLNAIDQSYLDQALTAQQIGQAYENAKVGVENQNIAEQNKANAQAWQNVQNTLNSFGTLAGYYAGSKALQGAGTQAATQAQNTMSPLTQAALTLPQNQNLIQTNPVQDVLGTSYLSQYFPTGTKLW